MPSSEIRSFLGHLRGELAKLPVGSRPARGELLRRAFEIPLKWPAYEFPEGRSLPEQFEKAILPWGGKVHRVKDAAEARAKALELSTEAGAKRFSRWRTPFLDGLGLEGALEPLAPEWVRVTPEEVERVRTHAERIALFERMEKIDVGLIDCDRAVAHTGSLVVYHDAVREGLTNLLPWTLIAFVRESQIVATVQEAAEGIAADFATRPVPNQLLFITGPSRSGDIDLRVGQGAAGPGRHHVIAIAD